MIQTNDLTTSVQFGTDKCGTIAVNAKYRRLILQELAREKQIGDKIEDGDARELPKIEMNFSSTKSIDVLIEALEKIKDNFEPNPYDVLASAC